MIFHGSDFEHQAVSSLENILKFFLQPFLFEKPVKWEAVKPRFAQSFTAFQVAAGLWH